MNREEILKTNKHYWDTYADLWFGTTALPARKNRRSVDKAQRGNDPT